MGIHWQLPSIVNAVFLLKSVFLFQTFFFPSDMALYLNLQQITLKTVGEDPIIFLLLFYFF